MVTGSSPFFVDLCYNGLMDFEYSIGWLFGGILITVAGALVVIFYKQIADNLANGVSSYDRVKLFGVIAVVVGLICVANLHTFLLTLFVHLITGK